MILVFIFLCTVAQAQTNLGGGTGGGGGSGGAGGGDEIPRPKKPKWAYENLDHDILAHLEHFSFSTKATSLDEARIDCQKRFMDEYVEYAIKKKYPDVHEYDYSLSDVNAKVCDIKVEQKNEGQLNCTIDGLSLKQCVKMLKIELKINQEPRDVQKILPSASPIKEPYGVIQDG